MAILDFRAVNISVCAQL